KQLGVLLHRGEQRPRPRRDGLEHRRPVDPLADDAPPAGDLDQVVHGRGRQPGRVHRPRHPELPPGPLPVGPGVEELEHPAGAAAALWLAGTAAAQTTTAGPTPGSTTGSSQAGTATAGATGTTDRIGNDLAAGLAAAGNRAPSARTNRAGKVLGRSAADAAAGA